MAIGQMIAETAGVFLDVEARVLRGDHDVALGDIVPSRDELEALKKLARKQRYKAADVVEIELAGYVPTPQRDRDSRPDRVIPGERARAASEVANM